MTNKLVNVRVDRTNVDINIDKTSLEGLLKKHKAERQVRSEHWWKRIEPWLFMIFNHNNPFTYKSVNPELELLWNNKGPLSEFLNKRLLIFYGLGAGETESAMVDIALNKNKKIEVVGIDIIKQFIDLYVHALWMMGFENKNKDIMYKGCVQRFQAMEKKQLEFSNSEYKQKNHIALGNIVANLGEELFSIISSLSNNGDYMTIGFNTPKHAKILFEKCKASELFPYFILNYEPELTKLEWKLTKEPTIITAESEGIERFRSRLFKPKELEEIASHHGYKLLYTALDPNGHSCIQVYEKTITPPKLIES